MHERKFKCKQCGNCCEFYGTRYGLEITQEDFQKWKDAGAYYILAFVKSYWRKGKEYGVREIWRNPKNKSKRLHYCPFLYETMDKKGTRKRKCGIHELKPEDCRVFMTPRWEDRFECKGYGSRGRTPFG